MARYPYLVESAWRVVEAFLADWQKQPYLWMTELDIQVEVASRLASVYRAEGSATILANYRDVVPGYEGRQLWSRVTCEPPIHYVYKDETSSVCRPDIVVWDDADNPDDPPDATTGDWPILWACEIKYGSQDLAGWDVEKLCYLVRQRKAAYGCWLNVSRMRASSGSGLDWKKHEEERVWICDARLPPSQ